MSIPDLRQVSQWSKWLWLSVAAILAAVTASFSNAERIISWIRNMWALLLYFHDQPIRREIESKAREHKLKPNPNVPQWGEDSFVHELDRKPSSVRRTLLRLEKAGIAYEVTPNVWQPGKRPERKPLWT
jgi:hypothetical protein